MELEMPNTAPDQKHELGHQARTPALPGPDADLDASVTHTDRQRPTSDEAQPSHDRGLVVMLWLLALLIAEIEFWTLAFAHMYRT
jgi:hypothetical protein